MSGGAVDDRRTRLTARAIEALARSWNRLDPELLRPWLREDVRYDSLDTELAIEGRAQVLSYLARKVELIEQLGDAARVRAQLGYVAVEGDPQRPCVISGQGELDQAALFLVTVDAHGLISRVRIVTSDPHPSLAVGSGVFPD